MGFGFARACWVQVLRILCTEVSANNKEPTVSDQDLLGDPLVLILRERRV